MMRPAAALAHALDHRPGHGEHRIEVGAEHRRPLVEGHLVEHAVAGDAGIVDEHVDRPEIGLDLLDAGGAGGGVGHVPLVGGDAGLGLELRRGLVVAGIGRGNRVAGRLQPLAIAAPMPRVPPVTMATFAMPLPPLDSCCCALSVSALDAHGDAHAAADAERGEALLRVRGAASRGEA